MVISVIGDYDSPEYKELLQKVKMAKPEEKVMDLSRHQSLSWDRMRKSRFEDITNSHLVVIGSDFRNSVEARRDITHAQNISKDCKIYRDGQFLPFPEYADRI